MDFGKLFSRTWDTLWNNAFLILLSVLIVLGNGNSSGASQSRYLFGADDFSWGDIQPSDFGGAVPDFDFSVLAVGGVILLVVALVLFGLVLWALGQIARGGMISAVNDIEEEKPAGFVAAFQAGWEKGWRLLGIGLVPAIPGLIFFVIAISLMFFTGFDFSSDPGWEGTAILVPMLAMTCLFVPVILVISALQTFANRACMLEDRGVIASYRRGWEVLMANLGPAVILFIIQLVINIVLGLIFFIPAILAAMCCLLWPLLIFVQAAFTAFYSILWTLAWREWVGITEV
jgi:hypothetical protein